MTMAAELHLSPSSNANVASGTKCFDPVAHLPGDLTAHCLSFVGVPSLVDQAQYVNHEWYNAIDGGLPAVWREVSIGPSNARSHFVTACKRSHGSIRSMQSVSSVVMEMLSRGIMLSSLSRLRVLHIRPNGFADFVSFSSDILSSLSLLQDLLLSLCRHAEVVFPAMPCLRTVSCDRCVVEGLHNLTSLTELSLINCTVNAEHAWSATLQHVTVMLNNTDNQQLLDRIAASPQLTTLTTDWSFARDHFFAPPFDHGSFLHSLQFYSTVVVPQGVFFLSRDPILYDRYLAAMTSLRLLSIERIEIQDRHLQGLLHLTTLQSIVLSHVDLTHECMRYITPLPNLAVLSLNSLPHFHDFSSIRSCRQLRDLQIDSHSPLSLAEVHIISQLPHLQNLELRNFRGDVGRFSTICAMTCLRALDVRVCITNGFITPAAFTRLSALTSLEKLCIHEIYDRDIPKLAECLVQMPKLKHISIGSSSMSMDIENMIRNALPRLESLHVSCGWLNDV